MQCPDAQFLLRLRRPAGDELGADVAADLDRHLAGCPGCGADARAAGGFDAAVATVMRAVPAPAALRDKLLAAASAHAGAVIRRRVYRVTALAASLLVAAGLGFGVFSASRPRIDTSAMALAGDEQHQNPDEALREFLAARKFPDRLPEPFDASLLVGMGTETVQGKDVPVVTFRHPAAAATERGFAKVFLFRTDGTYNLRDLQRAQASFTNAVVVDSPQFRGVKYVILHTVHPVDPGENPLKPFLRPPGQFARQ